MSKRKQEAEKENGERWLLTYSDMMNNLLILFMLLYAMSRVNEVKFEALAKQMNQTFGSQSAITASVDAAEISVGTGGNGSGEGDESAQDKFDVVYQTIQKEIKENGYEDILTIEKGDNYIKLRFGESVLFYPDSATIKTNNKVDMLGLVGNILATINPYIDCIDIGGHTATTGEMTSSFFSWELSSQRAVSVLEYLVQHCSLPESKMSVSGFSRYHPVASNATEASRQLNRRVEIKITRIPETTDSETTEDNETTHSKKE